MRILKLTVLGAAVVLFGCSGVAAAAPKNYCADLKGVDTGQACQIQMSDPGYNVNISFPTDYPDQKSVADYITQTRDGFLNVAKSPAPRDMPYELDITATNYGSAIPPRGTQAVVLKTYQNVGGAHPQPHTRRSTGTRPIASRSPTPRRRTKTKPSRCGSPPPTP